MFVTSVTDGIATVTLTRPPVNAINEEWVRSFDEELDRLAVRSDWSVLHIRSSLKAFCAGADLKVMERNMARPDGPDQMYAFVAGIQRLYRRIEALPQVVLAEINGAAMGGGLELALACDLRIAAHEAKLGLPEARLGLIPGAGGTQRLTRLCGRSVATRLILGAEVIDGRLAGELGVVHWAVPVQELAGRAAEIARRLAELPAPAIAASKACIAAAEQPGWSGYVAELEATRQLLSEAETKRRVQAFLAPASVASPRHSEGVA